MLYGILVVVLSIDCPFHMLNGSWLGHLLLLLLLLLKGFVELDCMAFICILHTFLVELGLFGLISSLFFVVVVH